MISILAGILANYFIEYLSKKFKKSYVLFILGVIVLMSAIWYLAAYFNIISINIENMNSIIKIFTGEKGDLCKLFMKIIVSAILFLFIVMIACSEDKKLTFKKYSKRIREFTNKAHEGSEITLIAGDMDFLGNVPIKGEDAPEKSMDNNKEYNQLISFKEKNIKLRVLCSFKITGIDMKKSLKGIPQNPNNIYKGLYHRCKSSLENDEFQNLLRIGKIKYDFRDNVKILFYESDSDNVLRARFVDNSGIQYRKESNGTYYDIFNNSLFRKVRGKSKNVKNKSTKIRKNELLYSVNELNNQEFAVYNSFFKQIWDGRYDVESENIVSFCKWLYEYENELNSEKYKMALIYVNSYEIARKGKSRKEFPPFGVLYLASSVEECGWDVDLIAVDENMKSEELDWTKYDIIGFSIVSSYSYDILKKCYDASAKRRDVLIVAGGYQAEKFQNEVFRDFDARIIFKGEGEESIKEVCQNYGNQDFAKIDGIVYRNAAGKTFANGGRCIVDIDKIPEPARSKLNTDDVVMKDRLAGTEIRMVHMLFSRGCIYSCKYCAANQDGNVKKIRYRNKVQIVKELKNLKATYNIEGFSIIDDCFLTDQQKAIEICNYIKEEKLGLLWSLAARVDQINDDILNALKNSGCIEIKFGIETGSDQLLRAMQKGTTVEKAEYAIKLTKSHNIGVKLFIITGLPGETDDTHNETKNFLSKMRNNDLVDRVSLLRYTPLPGSYIYENANNFGINKERLSIDSFSKMHLYKNSNNWWKDDGRFEKCNEWYSEMRELIDNYWPNS